MNETLSIHAASKMAGKSTTTVRRWIREKSITAKKAGDGRWQIDRHNLMAYLAQTPSHHVASMEPPQSGTHNDMDLTRTLHEALHRERQINDDLRTQLKEKDGELLKLTYEMKAVLEEKGGNILSRWLRS